MFTILIISIIVISGGFGFIRSLDFLAVSTPFGTFEIGQTLIIILIFGVILTKYKNDINLFSKKLFPFYLLIVIIIIQFFRSVIDVDSVREVIRNLKDGPFTFFIFYPLILLINSENKLKKFIDTLLFIGVSSAIVAIAQFIFQIKLDYSQIVEYQANLFRVYHPGATLFPLCIYFILSSILLKSSKRKLFIDITLLGILFIGIISTSHRSLIISTISLVLFLMFYLMYNNKKLNLVIVILLFISTLAFYQVLGEYFTGFLFDRVESAFTEIRYFEGNYQGRIQLFTLMFTEITKQSILFGIGFNYSNRYGSMLFVTNDNTYANMIIISGIIGLIVYIYILAYTVYKSKKIFNMISNEYYKSLLISIFAYSFQWLILGVFSDTLTYAPHILYLVCTWVILILIEYFRTSKNNYDPKLS